MTLDSLHKLIIDFIENTNRPIFLTGKAGTGKTTFLRYIRSNTHKNLAVVAPTAVAAINAGGSTIHSFFQVPFGPIPPLSFDSLFAEFYGKSFGPEKSKLIKCLDLLIIDEISMVRADTIDYIDRVLRFVKGTNQPFGGVQILMIGDLYQLPPVFQNDWHLLGKFYKGPYFFDSLVFKRSSLITFELEKVHRQNDPVFIEILNEIRSGAVSDALLAKLNANYQALPSSENLAHYVTLTTHNPLVKTINEERLQQLPGNTHTFKATVTGDFPKEAFPTEEELVLKTGAMVMFIKNDASGKKQFYNGRTAKVDSISGDTINVTFLDDSTPFEVGKEIWENNKYTLSETDQKVTQSSAGSFTQFPLRLAWAITIHKSQGLTFDKAIIDVGAAFAHGQTYVALSRCRNLNGLILKHEVKKDNIITDPAVSSFMKKAQQETPDQQKLKEATEALEKEVLLESFDFESIHQTYQQLKAVVIALLPDEALIIQKLTSSTELLEKKINAVAKSFSQKELVTTQQLKLATIRPRLHKASDYFLPPIISFHEHILDLHKLVEGTPFHADYFPTLNLLIEQLATKIEIFKLFADLPTVQAIIHAAKSSAVNYKALDSWKKKQSKIATVENPALYAQLLHWRKNTAEEKKLLGYHLISDVALSEIAAKLPRSLTALAKVKSVGEGKAAEYGEQILRLIKQHLGESDLFG
ncbi:HRDC domain-containing protein [Pedobacter insulae]|uniref:Helicase n=1 Tax=Pedobacter insulae TaxID=414048 RepID=A0A1I2WGT1_9SPHI|nr:HRDC domain-containing protein [Pedobacter insulae]SFH00458.1 Helicase [Pedobacter insulae]